MTVPDTDRARHMGLRVQRAAARAGVPGRDLLSAAHELAMAPRTAALDDDHDPRYLHPGRTFLVALGDAGVRDPGLLASAILLETLEPRLGASVAAVEEAADPALLGAWRVARHIPRPRDENLVERLVTSSEGVQRVALSEWLDQLRHLRHWAGEETVAWGLERTREVYLPLAERHGGTLARRLAWWMRRVAPGLTAAS